MAGRLGSSLLRPSALLAALSALLLLLSGLPVVGGSHGDQQPEYQECLANCERAEQCDRRRFPAHQSTINKFFGWTCPAECQYQCMWTVERSNRAAGMPVLQYHGKWPFRRIWGMQEPASALFSLGNFFAHAYGYYYIYRPGMRLVKTPSHWFLHSLVMANYYGSLNVWLWSAVFHSRDVYWTMLLDYASAVGLILIGMATSICRGLNIRERRRRHLLLLLCSLYYVRHIYYMTMVQFSFAWNMKVAGVALGIYFFFYISWSLAHLYHGKRSHSRYLLLACLSMIAGASLEILDFAPWLHLFDAHALWHAATVPISILWYKFYLGDLQYDMGITALPQHRRLNSVK